MRGAIVNTTHRPQPQTITRAKRPAPVDTHTTRWRSQISFAVCFLALSTSKTSPTVSRFSKTKSNSTISRRGNLSCRYPAITVNELPEHIRADARARTRQLRAASPPSKKATTAPSLLKPSVIRAMASPASNAASSSSFQIPIKENGPPSKSFMSATPSPSQK